MVKKKTGRVTRVTRALGITPPAPAPRSMPRGTVPAREAEAYAQAVARRAAFQARKRAR
jgi:hypothetical protein